MSNHPFSFDSIIYNGFDNVADGLGNHLSLLDRIVFNALPRENKSLSPIASRPAQFVYGKVETNLHLKCPERFRNALFLDIARETWNPEMIRAQMAKTVRHKRAYRAVTAVYLMWESDRLWDLYADLIAIYDFCIVTSSLLDSFLAARGIDFLKLTHPYDFETLLPGTTPDSGNKPVRFGISAGLWPRKNVALLAEVFAEAFAGDDSVQLCIHTRSDINHPDYRGEYQRIDKVRQGYPHIEIRAESLSRQAYLDWMRSLDVYCFISTGEGYSVTPREALHLGIPVILHDAHVHAEFSHLPGVVRVPSNGMQRARPNTQQAHYDIGNDWRIDRQALLEALRRCREQLPTLRAALVEGHPEIAKFHHPSRIREQWVTVLNDRFEAHLGDVRINYPGVDEYPLIDAGLADINLLSPGFRSATGLFHNGRAYCLRGEHQPGHCIYGPYLPVTGSTRVIVTVRIILLSSNVPDYLGTIDLYDSISGRILAMEHVLGVNCGAVENEIRIDSDLEPGQTLEIRIHWNGGCDWCVSDLQARTVDRQKVCESGAVD